MELNNTNNSNKSNNSNNINNSKIRLEWGGGFSDCLIDVVTGDVIVIEQNHEELEGLDLYYQSRSGLSGAGWFQCDPFRFIKTGSWRPDVAGVSPKDFMFSDPVEYMGWEIYMPIHGHRGLIPESGAPAILKSGKGVAFLHPYSVNKFIYDWHKTGRKEVEEYYDEDFWSTLKNEGWRKISLMEGDRAKNIWFHNPSHLRGPSLEILFFEKYTAWFGLIDRTSLQEKLELVRAHSYPHCKKGDYIPDGGYFSISKHGFAVFDWGSFAPDFDTIIKNFKNLPFGGFVEDGKIIFPSRDGLLEIWSDDESFVLVHPVDYYSKRVFPNWED